MTWLRNLIREEVKKNPTATNYEIAAIIGCHPKTVGIAKRATVHIISEPTWTCATLTEAASKYESMEEFKEGDIDAYLAWQRIMNERYVRISKND